MERPCEKILFLSVCQLLFYFIYNTNASDEEFGSPLTTWCLSNNFLNHLDYIAEKFPTHYKYCTTKTRTCKAFLQSRSARSTRYKGNHTEFFRYCRKKVKPKLFFIKDRNPEMVIFETNVVVDVSTLEFLQDLFGTQYENMVEKYVNNLLHTASKILSKGMSDRDVVFLPLNIVYAALSTHEDKTIDTHVLYNSWCSKAHDVLSQQNIMKADMHIILSKKFSKLTGHVGYTMKDAMCAGKWSCTIIQDDGPQLTPVVIAHETAHLLGMPHIEETNKCSKNSRFSVMSEELLANNRQFEWSDCIKERLQNIQNEFSCLQKRLSPETLRRFVGINRIKDEYAQNKTCAWSPDVQCKMMFNNVEMEFCASKKRQRMVCNRLYCSIPRPTAYGTRNSYICQSRSVGALEGTSCGEDGLCINGRCVKRKR